MSTTVIARGLFAASTDATETVALYVPVGRAPGVACSVSVAGVVVVVSVAVSHPACADSAKAIALLSPVACAGTDDVMLITDGEGFASPETKANAVVVADNWTVGGAVTVNVTATMRGLLEAPEAEICTVAVYAPGVRPATDAVSCSVEDWVAVADALDRVAVSHPAGCPLAKVMPATASP